MGTFKSYEIVYIAVQLVLSISVVFLNGLFLITFAKKSSLHTPSNTVLGCLCCNDLLMGLLTLLLLLFTILKRVGINFETVYIALFYTSLLCIAYSCLFVVLANLDRYAAICHPFAYLQHATVRLSGVISFYASLLCTLVVIVPLLLDRMYSSYSAAVVFIIMVCVVVLILIYCNGKIIRVICRHRRQITSTRLNNDRHHSGFQGEAKRYHLTVLLVILFVACKLPPTLFFMTVVIWKVKSTLPITIWSMLADVLLVLNCLFNPLVYFFSIRVYRNAVKEVMCCQNAEWYVCIEFDTICWAFVKIDSWNKWLWYFHSDSDVQVSDMNAVSCGLIIYSFSKVLARLLWIRVWARTHLPEGRFFCIRSLSIYHKFNSLLPYVTLHSSGFLVYHLDSSQCECVSIVNTLIFSIIFSIPGWLILFLLDHNIMAHFQERSSRLPLIYVMWMQTRCL